MDPRDDVARRLRELPAAEPPDGLLRAILDDVPPGVALPVAARARPRHPSRVASLGLAASLLLALGLGWRLIPRTSPPEHPPRAMPTLSIAPPAAPPAAPSSVAGALPEPYAYERAGRRDPYDDAWSKRRGAPRPAGPEGMEIADLSLQGIVISPDGRDRVALVMASDMKGYGLREGDLLWNGKVKAIEGDRVVFLQRVTDALSVREFTEVVKRLPAGES